MANHKSIKYVFDYLPIETSIDYKCDSGWYKLAPCDDPVRVRGDYVIKVCAVYHDGEVIDFLYVFWNQKENGYGYGMHLQKLDKEFTILMMKDISEVIQLENEN